jgi:hypothetical protein
MEAKTPGFVFHPSPAPEGGNSLIFHANENSIGIDRYTNATSAGAYTGRGT